MHVRHWDRKGENEEVGQVSLRVHYWQVTMPWQTGSALQVSAGSDTPSATSEADTQILFKALAHASWEKSLIERGEREKSAAR